MHIILEVHSKGDIYIMQCKRCGAENYDEAYFCKTCGAKVHKSKDKSSNNYFLIKPNGFWGQNCYRQKYGIYLSKDNDKYTQQPSKNYTYNKQYHRHIKTYSNKTLHTYTPDINKINGNKYGGQTDKVSKCQEQNNSYVFASTLISVITIITILIISLTVVFALWYKEQDSDSLGIKAFVYGNQKTQEIQVLEIPTIPHIEIYTAKLSGEICTITDFSNNLITVEFPIPKGYDQDYSNQSYVSFNREINNDVAVKLSAVVFSSDIQKEIDYFSELQNKNRLSFDLDIIDTDLGEMTVVTLSGGIGKTTAYHAYVRLDGEKYFHITLSNVTEEYKTEARKLIDLMVQNSEVVYRNE